MPLSRVITTMFMTMHMIMVMDPIATLRNFSSAKNATVSKNDTPMIMWIVSLMVFRLPGPLLNITVFASIARRKLCKITY